MFRKILEQIKSNYRQILILLPLDIILVAVAAVSVIAVSRMPDQQPVVVPDNTSVTEPAVSGEVTPPDSGHSGVTDYVTGNGVVTGSVQTDKPVTDAPPVTEPPVKDISDHPDFTSESALLGSGIASDYGILVDLEKNTVVASKNSRQRMYPASLTKVMTVYVASRYISEDEFNTRTFTMTNEIIAPLWQQNATRAGFAPNEEVLLIDYMYGAILPSGADATIALATYIAGGEKEFAVLMNKVAGELKLKNSHFTNSTGLHDPDHYTTAEDIAVIFRAALSSDICRKVLTTFKYTTHSTAQNPSGITMYSTAISRMSPYNYLDGLDFVGGKTGFTDEAKQCLAVLADVRGREYIMVTGHATMKEEAVTDVFSSVKKYCYR